MWSPEVGWLWWDILKHDYKIPHLHQGKVWNHQRKRYEVLDLITTGALDQPWKILIHGMPGVGKTSLAASFPSPVFADLEGSTDRYEVARVDLRQMPFSAMDEKGNVDKDAPSVMNLMRQLRHADHQYKTLVIDTLDWLEPKIWEATCRRLKIPTMETMGYGKAYMEADKEWDAFKTYCNYIHAERQMNIVLLAHTTQNRVYDKDFNEMTRWDIKLQKRAAARFIEWAELIGFLTYDTYLTRTNGKESSKHDGKRVLMVHEIGSYVAKNRFGYDGEPISPINYDTMKGALHG